MELSRDLGQQLDRTRKLIAEACECDPLEVCDVRPPYGAFTPDTLKLLERWHYRPVMWSIVPLHWVQPMNRTVAQVKQQTRRGSIIVLHEGQPHSPPVAEITDRVVEMLTTAGFHFVTINEMWEHWEE